MVYFATCVYLLHSFGKPTVALCNLNLLFGCIIVCNFMFLARSKSMLHVQLVVKLLLSQCTIQIVLPAL